MRLSRRTITPLEFDGLRIFDYTAGQALSSSIATIDVPPGGRHAEAWSRRSDKYYLVSDGEIEFVLDGESQPLAAGDFCFVKRGRRFSYANKTAQTATLVLVHTPSFDVREEVSLAPDAPLARDSAPTRIEGGCHCGNIRYSLEWPTDPASITTRVCGCSFCIKHGGHWTSHRDAALHAEIAETSQISKYRFGTETADFFVCARCGGVPFVTCSIAGRDYAVVNANTFEGVDATKLSRAPVTFEGESTASRLERRQRNWISRVRIRG